MVDLLNFILLKGHSAEVTSSEKIESWLQDENNYNRLQAQFDKIWDNCRVNPQYDAERAFQVLSKRFIEVCYLEQDAK